MIFCGIDPGMTGAMAAVDENGRHLCHNVIPVLGGKLDARKLINWLYAAPGFTGQTKDDLFVTIEDVHAVFNSSAKSTFNFGFVCGGIQAVVQTLLIPYALVQPKIWQKSMWQGVPELRKPSTTSVNTKGKSVTRKGSIRTKEMSLVAISRLYPEVSVLKTPNCTIPHDGIVDAILIAEYGRRSLC